MPNYLKATIDPYAEVRPRKGVLRRCVDSIERQPRKMRWNKYLRACRAIPKKSPVHGTYSWKRINRRRHWVIDRMFQAELHKREFRLRAEYEALQHVAGTVYVAVPTVYAWLSQRAINRVLKKADTLMARMKKNHARGVNKRRLSGMKKL